MRIMPINGNGSSLQKNNKSFGAKLEITQMARKIIAKDINRARMVKSQSPSYGYMWALLIDGSLQKLKEKVESIQPYNSKIKLDASRAYKEYEKINATGKGFEKESKGNLELYISRRSISSDFTYDIEDSDSQVERLYSTIKEKLENSV